MRQPLFVNNPDYYANIFISKIKRYVKYYNIFFLYGISHKRTIELILEEFQEITFIIADDISIINLLKFSYENDNKYKYIPISGDETDIEKINKYRRENDMPKFDVACVNAPYENNFHLVFLQNIIDNCANLVINIGPYTWMAKHYRWKPTFLKYKETSVGKPTEIVILSHRESNDLFSTGNSNENLAISVYDNQNPNKLDILKFDFVDEIEFSIYIKIFTEKPDKYILRNNKNIVETNKVTKKYTRPINIWRTGNDCFDTILGMSKKMKNGKSQWCFQCDTEKEIINFENSMKTKFMDWFCKNIIAAAYYKIHMTAFVMNDYTLPWTDSRFCNYFNITGYIDDEHAEPGSEWERILNTYK